jgi:hypothetical protein
MVGNGNHPLIESHYDENHLHDYVLENLPPDEEERIRQHLMICPLCRAAAADMRAFCQQLARGLHEELDNTQPGPQLSFDRIAARRRTPVRWLLFRLQQLVPGTSLVLLVVLLIVVALQGLWTPNEANPLHGLRLTDQYAGPPAVIAAATNDGLVVMRLSADHSGVVAFLNDVTSPHSLQFSPNGQWLAFRQENTLFVRAVDQETAYRFPVRASAKWAWSPDSRMLAYTDGNGQLIIFDPVDNASRGLVPAEDAAWGVPVWDEDGRHISYTVLKPLNTTAASYMRQGIRDVSVDTGYRAELVRNPVPYDTLLVANASPPSNELRPLPSDLAPSQEVLPERILRSRPLASSTNGEWTAYIVSEPMQGQGLYLVSFSTGEQRLVDLPGDATDRAAFWGDSGHLFVIRQVPDTTASELWIVPLAAGEAPRQVLSDFQISADSDWRDRLSVQLLPP